MYGGTAAEGTGATPAQNVAPRGRGWERRWLPRFTRAPAVFAGLVYFASEASCWTSLSKRSKRLPKVSLMASTVLPMFLPWVVHSETPAVSSVCICFNIVSWLMTFGARSRRVSTKVATCVPKSLSARTASNSLANAIMRPSESLKRVATCIASAPAEPKEAPALTIAPSAPASPWPAASSKASGVIPNSAITPAPRSCILRMTLPNSSCACSSFSSFFAKISNSSVWAMRVSSSCCKRLCTSLKRPSQFSRSNRSAITLYCSSFVSDKVRMDL
mmetsp:Transcript_106839/g.299130  ORF Transcript_106839/g.299130 Transcript_106839/m.299130 type:complete len:274 (-) Transcript_106839:955-1776(-)